MQVENIGSFFDVIPKGNLVWDEISFVLLFIGCASV
jgi:hypothetical protein